MKKKLFILFVAISSITINTYCMKDDRLKLHIIQTDKFNNILRDEIISNPLKWQHFAYKLFSLPEFKLMMSRRNKRTRVRHKFFYNVLESDALNS